MASPLSDNVYGNASPMRPSNSPTVSVPTTWRPVPPQYRIRRSSIVAQEDSGAGTSSRRTWWYSTPTVPFPWYKTHPASVTPSTYPRSVLRAL
eukprot:3941277-Rhodomonas_salina.4